MKKRIFDLAKIFLRPIYRFIVRYITNAQNRKQVKILKNITFESDVPIIYYLGTTTHNNLGDNAQFFCIRQWIKNNYSSNKTYEFTAPAIVDPSLDFVKILKEKYREQDIIIFQSGYTTQDLGGQHEEMHRLIIDNIPYANILMMPQTIFFQHKENEIRCSKSYNQAKNMLFLARDSVSFEIAKKMFPQIRISLFPDIVTTLIGKYDFDFKRSGILLCRRNDSEKYYLEEDLLALKKRIETNTNEKVLVSDTTIDIFTHQLHKNLKKYLENEFVKYSKYKAIITDRYHGTIFSLIANTPVIVIKTNDHKVITGVDWFKGVYDCVYYADSLDDAYSILNKILAEKKKYKLHPYFKNKYYDNLKSLFETICSK